jgi:hypothetical protein
MKGYIYVRNHPSYDEENACILGKTENIYDTDALYTNNELIRGHYGAVFELYTSINIIERLLKNEFSELNILFDGGSDFYNKDIINMIEPFFERNDKIKYRKLSMEEIELLLLKR